MLQRTNIYLPLNLLNYFKSIARKEGTTMAAVIRKRLEKQIDKENSSEWAKNLLEISKKSGKSKYKDLAKNHDQYLFRDKK